MSDSDWLPRSTELMSADRTAVVVIDVQEKLVRQIPEHRRLVWNVQRLIEGANLFDVPVVATEQYPRGLGPTVPEIAGYWSQSSSDDAAVAAEGADGVERPARGSAGRKEIPAKTSFSCRACPELFRDLSGRGVDRLLLTGIETHVCLLQTALDLLAAGFRVFVAVDATGSRHPLDREIALRRLEASGAVLTTTEAALFEWCGDAAVPQFSQLRQLVVPSGPSPRDRPASGPDEQGPSSGDASPSPAVPGPVQPPVRRLLGPGPSDVPPSVLEALARGTVGHLDPYYLDVMDEMQQMLRQVFRTENRLTLAVSGTGSAGQEATIANLVEPGDPVVVCVNGVFGGRLAEMAERVGGVVTRVERPWGEVFEVDDLADTLDRVRPKLVAIVLAETSTGAWQPIEAISRLVHDQGALLLVDAVTALGGVPVEVDRWQIDAVYAGTQKCLSCPPGLAPVSFSPRAVERIEARKRKVTSWYLDVSLLSAYWGQQRTYHHTAPINMTYALHEALRRVLDEGLDACFARHRLHHEALRAGLAAMNVHYAGQPGHRLPQLNAVQVPPGVRESEVRRGLLNRFGIEIGAGLGELRGRVWRIGLMGYSSRADNVLLLLAALDQLLAEQSHPFPRGAAVAAAQQYYHQHAQAGG